METAASASDAARAAALEYAKLHKRLAALEARYPALGQWATPDTEKAPRHQSAAGADAAAAVPVVAGAASPGGLPTAATDDPLPRCTPPANARRSFCEVAPVEGASRSSGGCHAMESSALNTATPSHATVTDDACAAPPTDALAAMTDDACAAPPTDALAAMTDDSACVAAPTDTHAATADDAFACAAAPTGALAAMAVDACAAAPTDARAATMLGTASVADSADACTNGPCAVAVCPPPHAASSSVGPVPHAESLTDDPRTCGGGEGVVPAQSAAAGQPSEWCLPAVRTSGWEHDDVCGEIAGGAVRALTHLSTGHLAALLADRVLLWEPAPLRDMSALAPATATAINTGVGAHGGRHPIASDATGRSHDWRHALTLAGGAGEQYHLLSPPPPVTDATLGPPMVAVCGTVDSALANAAQAQPPHWMSSNAPPGVTAPSGVSAPPQSEDPRTPSLAPSVAVFRVEAVRGARDMSIPPPSCAPRPASHGGAAQATAAPPRRPPARRIPAPTHISASLLLPFHRLDTTADDEDAGLFLVVGGTDGHVRLMRLTNPSAETWEALPSPHDTRPSLMGAANGGGGESSDRESLAVGSLCALCGYLGLLVGAFEWGAALWQVGTRTLINIFERQEWAPSASLRPAAPLAAFRPRWSVWATPRAADVTPIDASCPEGGGGLDATSLLVALPQPSASARDDDDEQAEQAVPAADEVLGCVVVASALRWVRDDYATDDDTRGDDLVRGGDTRDDCMGGDSMRDDCMRDDPLEKEPPGGSECGDGAACCPGRVTMPEWRPAHEGSVRAPLARAFALTRTTCAPHGRGYYAPARLGGVEAAAIAHLATDGCFLLGTTGSGRTYVWSTSDCQCLALLGLGVPPAMGALMPASYAAIVHAACSTSVGCDDLLHAADHAGGGDGDGGNGGNGGGGSGGSLVVVRVHGDGLWRQRLGWSAGAGLLVEWQRCVQSEGVWPRKPPAHGAAFKRGRATLAGDAEYGGKRDAMELEWLPSQQDESQSLAGFTQDLG